jgi:hypothetical protein
MQINPRAFFLCGLSLAMSIASTGARSENCWMVGCVGTVGYIYLPTVPDPELKQVSRCTPSKEAKIFNESYIPDVNAIVSVAWSGTQLIDERAIENFNVSFPSVSTTTDETGCHQTWMQLSDRIGSPMLAAAKVRILGYRTFIVNVGSTAMQGPTVQKAQGLFALVLVESDQ